MGKYKISSIDDIKNYTAHGLWLDFEKQLGKPFIGESKTSKELNEFFFYHLLNGRRATKKLL